MIARAAAHSCSQAGIARALGVSHALVTRWADPTDPLSMTLRDVVACPRSFRRELGKELVSGADDDETLAHIPIEQHALLIGAATGELLGALAQAKADGEIDAAELKRLEQVIARIRARVGAADRELQTRG